MWFTKQSNKTVQKKPKKHDVLAQLEGKRKFCKINLEVLARYSVTHL